MMLKCSLNCHLYGLGSCSDVLTELTDTYSNIQLISMVNVVVIIVHCIKDILCPKALTL